MECKLEKSKLQDENQAKIRRKRYHINCASYNHNCIANSGRNNNSNANTETTGVLTQADNAKKTNDEATAKEKLSLILTDKQVEAYSNSREIAINNELAEEIASETAQGVTSSVFTGDAIAVTIDGYKFNVTDLMNIESATEGKIEKALTYEIVDEACIKITCTNPEALVAKNDEEENGKIAREENEESKELAKVASTGDVKIASETLAENKETENLKVAEAVKETTTYDIIYITTPDGDTLELDPNDEGSSVEYWAYKSKTYAFKLQYGEETSKEIMTVPVDIPVTDESWFVNNNGHVTLKDYDLYYERNSYNFGSEYSLNILNIPQNILSGGTLRAHYMSGGQYDNIWMNSITTLILPEDVEVYSVWKGASRTIFIPSSCVIKEEALATVPVETVVHLGASADSSNLEEGYDNGCSAKILYNQ